MSAQFVESQQNIWFMQQDNIKNNIVIIKKRSTMYFFSCVLGGFTILDKIYYLWLELLRESNAIINCEYIKENISNSSIIALFKGENVIDEKLNNSIVKSFLDKNNNLVSINPFKIRPKFLSFIEREIYPYSLKNEEDNSYYPIFNLLNKKKS